MAHVIEVLCWLHLAAVPILLLTHLWLDR